MHWVLVYCWYTGSEKDVDGGTDVESTGIGISYQVNDDLAVSYGTNTMEKSGSERSRVKRLVFHTQWDH